jgi:hypothetical protein
MQTRVLEPRPLVLLGDCWPPIVAAWQQHLAVNDDDVRLLKFAQTADEAVGIMRESAAAAASP